MSAITGSAISARNGIYATIASAGESLQPLPRELLTRLDGMKEGVDSLMGAIGPYIGRAERAFGDLAPKVAKEFYETEGFAASETSVEVDTSFKIDVIATRSGEVRATQVKKGEVSPEEIREIFNRASDYLVHNYSEPSKTVEVIAKTFPRDFLEIRDELMREHPDVTLSYLPANTVTKTLSKYRYVFENP